MITKGYRLTFLAVLLFLTCASMIAPASLRAQTSNDATQTSLADVVKRQKEEQLRGKRAKRVISDEDSLGPHLHQVQGMAASTVIIPYITITGMIPDGVTMSVPPDPKQKMMVSFGPSLDSCFDLECAESTYLRLLPLTFGGRPRVLFDTEDSIQGNAARIVHLEITHDVRGKMLATVAFIQTPASVATASCIYKASDAPDVETDCEAFIGSLQIHVPERYIYVRHNNY